VSFAKRARPLNSVAVQLRHTAGSLQGNARESRLCGLRSGNRPVRALAHRLRVRLRPSPTLAGGGNPARVTPVLRLVFVRSTQPCFSIARTVCTFAPRLADSFWPSERIGAPLPPCSICGLAGTPKAAG